MWESQFMNKIQYYPEYKYKQTETIKHRKVKEKEKEKEWNYKEQQVTLHSKVYLCGHRRKWPKLYIPTEEREAKIQNLHQQDNHHF